MGVGSTRVLPSPSMFFVLSKLLDLAIDPLWWSLVPIVVGVVLLARGRRRRLALGLVTFGITVSALACLPSLSNRLWGSLEDGVVSTMKDGVTYDAVVLLGGVVNPLGSLKDEPAWNDNIERVLEVRTDRKRDAATRKQMFAEIAAALA